MSFSPSDTFPSHRRTLSAFWTIHQHFKLWDVSLCSPALTWAFWISKDFTPPWYSPPDLSYPLPCFKWRSLCQGTTFLGSILPGCCLSHNEICTLWGFSALALPVSCSTHVLSEALFLSSSVLSMPSANWCLSLCEGSLYILGISLSPPELPPVFGILPPGTQWKPHRKPLVGE